MNVCYGYPTASYFASNSCKQIGKFSPLRVIQIPDMTHCLVAFSSA